MSCSTFNILNNFKKVLFKPELKLLYKENIDLKVWETPGYLNNCAIYAILLNLIFQGKCIVWKNNEGICIEKVSKYFVSDDYLLIICKIIRGLIGAPPLTFIDDNQLQKLTKILPLSISILEYDSNTPMIYRVIESIHKPSTTVFLAFHRSQLHWEHFSHSVSCDVLLEITNKYL
jgi:hypothetical protein